MFEFKPSVEVLILPKAVGRRILTIEGSGVRALNSLKILVVVEKMLGHVKLRNLFDLIAGCGSGGLVALPLAVQDWTLEEIVQRVFSQVYSESVLPLRWWFARPFSAESHYEETLTRVLRKIFGQKSEAKLAQVTVSIRFSFCLKIVSP